MAAIVVLIVIVVIVLAANNAKAGQDFSWTIPVPTGTKVEVNSPAKMSYVRENSTVVVTVAASDANAKAKARWQYGNEQCYSDGSIGQVLTDIERCANARVGKRGMK
jgi:hypothetical protein